MKHLYLIAAVLFAFLSAQSAQAQAQAQNSIEAIETYFDKHAEQANLIEERKNAPYERSYATTPLTAAATLYYLEKLEEKNGVKLFKESLTTMFTNPEQFSQLSAGGPASLELASGHTLIAARYPRQNEIHLQYVIKQPNASTFIFESWYDATTMNPILQIKKGFSVHSQYGVSFAEQSGSNLILGQVTQAGFQDGC